jgi:2-oxoglutarate ferredoxin oxidoreductase subunit beta
MALQLGASFVARSFSGDKRQLVPLIKAGLMHHGFAFIDVISPCVAFNNHAGSTKSFDYVRDHSERVTVMDFVMDAEEVTADYEPGTTEDVAMPDGSILRLHKLDAAYDPHDRADALHYVQTRQAEGGLVTGLLYMDPEASDCHEVLQTVTQPLNGLVEADLCPGNEALAAINESFR